MRVLFTMFMILLIVIFLVVFLAVAMIVVIAALKMSGEIDRMEEKQKEDEDGRSDKQAGGS